MPRKKSVTPPIEQVPVTNEKIMEFLKALQAVVEKPSPEVEALRKEIAELKSQMAEIKPLKPTPEIKRMFESNTGIDRDFEAARRRQVKELVPYTPSRSETVICQGVPWKLESGKETHVPPGVIVQIEEARGSERENARQAEEIQRKLNVAAAKLREITDDAG